MSSHKIKLYPRFKALQYAPYFKALIEKYGYENIEYGCEEFPALNRHGLAYEIWPERIKVYIDHRDSISILENAMQWCDVYAKTNLVPEEVGPAHRAKVIAIGPGFPFRIFGPFRTAWESLKTYGVSRERIKGIRKIQDHFSGWRSQYKHRRTEDFYNPGKTADNYIFYSGSIWKEETECNQWRANFFEACQSISWVRFEGGFRPRAQNDVPGYEKYTDWKHYSHDDFVEKTRESALVFNCPAVDGCHGWKLAEYLCLGKAIISIPPKRALPEPLTHGENVHFVDGSVEANRDAIEKICQDKSYREKIEAGARAYYDHFLNPRIVLRRIHEFAKKPANGFGGVRGMTDELGTHSSSFSQFFVNR